MQRVVPAWLRGYGSVILLLATLCNMAAFMTFNAYGLTLPGMSDALGLSHTEEGTLVTAVSVSVMTSGVVTGILAMRYQSRYVVGVAGLVGGTAMFGLGASPNYATALVTGAVAGFGMQVCITGSMGLVPLWFGSSHRGAAAGLASAGGGLSFVVLGTLVPWLSGRDPDDGWRHSWYALGVIGVTTGALCLALMRDMPGAAVRPRTGSLWPREIYRSYAVWLLAFMAFSGAWSSVLYSTYFGLFLEENGVGLDVSGRLWWIMGILGVGSALFWGYFSDRKGPKVGFFLTGLIYMTGILVLWLVPVLAGFVVSVVLVGICLRANFTLCAAAMGTYAPVNVSTAAFGMTALGAGLGLSIWPPVGGAIADATDDLGWAFALAALGAAVGAIVALQLRRPRANGPLRGGV